MKYISLLIGLFFLRILHGQIIHIPDDFATIQQGIDASANGDTVLVEQGEYFENINFKGKNIVVCSNFPLNGNPEDIIQTIINGGNPVHPDTASCVLIVSGENSSAVLEGFTLTGGSGTLWEDEHGPNNFYTEGGAILIQASSPIIKNNIISGNEAINVPSGAVSAGGGAIRVGDGNPLILNNIITFNQGRYGGGIVLNFSGALIKNNIIAFNSGGQDYGGGGLWCYSNGADPIIINNNTIVNNHSVLGGGGIRLWSAVSSLTNNIFWGNTATIGSQIQGGSGTISYCCVENGWAGTGNINVNPQFITGNFILDDNSECIDSGNPDALFNDPEDPNNAGFALYPAKGGLASDIGVYGGPGCSVMPQILTAVSNPVFFEEKVHLQQNPVANQAIQLKSFTNENCGFTYYINDMFGNICKKGTVVLSQNESLTISISDISTGAYLLKIVFNNGSTESKKLIVL